MHELGINKTLLVVSNSTRRQPATISNYLKSNGGNIYLVLGLGQAHVEHLTALFADASIVSEDAHADSGATGVDLRVEQLDADLVRAWLTVLEHVLDGAVTSGEVSGHEATVLGNVVQTVAEVPGGLADLQLHVRHVGVPLHADTHVEVHGAQEALVDQRLEIEGELGVGVGQRVVHHTIDVHQRRDFNLRESSVPVAHQELVQQRQGLLELLAEPLVRVLGLHSLVALLEHQFCWQVSGTIRQGTVTRTLVVPLVHAVQMVLEALVSAKSVLHNDLRQVPQRLRLFGAQSEGN